ncbi:DUF3047 domain-containing protein [Planktotalea sp.]|uniref:DUF3047 domain-containing protein n=1 Tax=Planktotalea sp. TaxID=2029877 RepID=UPI0032977498
MKKLLIALAILTVGAGVYWQTRPSLFESGTPLTANNGAIDLLAELNTDALSDGWFHRTFFTANAANYQMTLESGAPALRCTTDNSASILARNTEIPLSELNILSWRWKVDQPIESNVDEDTKDGDDHPLRFFVRFSNEDGDIRAAEIIWSNKKYAPGEYKIIDGFYHYVANGLHENTKVWHDHSLDLRQLYTDIGGKGEATLQTLGFFCDSDNTGAKSDGVFADIHLSAAPA